MLCRNTDNPISSADCPDRKSRADIAASFQVALVLLYGNITCLEGFKSFLQIIIASWYSWECVVQRVAVLHLEERCQRAIEWALNIEPSIKHLVIQIALVCFCILERQNYCLAIVDLVRAQKCVVYFVLYLFIGGFRRCCIKSVCQESSWFCSKDERSRTCLSSSKPLHWQW